MASQHSVCKFQQVSSAAAYNIINVRNQHSRLVYLDMRHDPRTPFPTAILPLRGLADNSSDLCVVLSCLRSCLSGDHAARCRIVLFIEERRLAAIEHDIATRLCGTADADFALLAAHRMKYCCVDIDPLFQSVPPEFIGAALSAASAPRVPSLIECLLPRNVFLCEQKLVAQALNPISGLGVCCVLNVTPNPPAHRPDITRSFPIEDNADGDIESGMPLCFSSLVSVIVCLQSALRPEHCCMMCWGSSRLYLCTVLPASAGVAALSSTL